MNDAIMNAEASKQFQELKKANSELAALLADEQKPNIEIVKRTLGRRQCEECGAEATLKHTFLLPNPRNNPASSAYGRDDCTWCSDNQMFLCDDCKRPEIDGYEWCATFNADKMPTLFKQWHEEKLFSGYKV